VLLIFATYTLSSSLFGGGQGDNLASQPTLSAQDAERADVLKKIELTAQLPWPDYGQAAFGAARGGVVVRSDNADQPVPIASLAKVITALAVLDKKPLQPGEQGPLITLTEQDEANYWEYVRKQGSVTPVKAGVQVSQYQAMQAMLLPSSNNMADALVVWAFGSMDNYVSYANNMVKELGFSKTTVADASGYSPLTKSTAAEMVGLGFLFIDNPVLQDIAKQPEADIPFAGKIHNYNDGINNDGILGLKVGFTDEAGKTFLAADFPGTGRDDISLAVVLGAADWQTLLNDTKTLLLSGKEEYKRAESS
jgi:D-alanyl-D-alanine carboxypeptidase (penicillin-binding protein 5/6)